MDDVVTLRMANVTQLTRTTEERELGVDRIDSIYFNDTAFVIMEVTTTNGKQLKINGSSVRIYETITVDECIESARKSALNRYCALMDRYKGGGRPKDKEVEPLATYTKDIVDKLSENDRFIQKAVKTLGKNSLQQILALATYLRLTFDMEG